MDHASFDRFVRALGSTASRRRLLGLGFGTVAGALLGVGRQWAALGACPPGWDDCNGDGICEDLQYDPVDCGICGNDCSTFGFAMPACCSYNCVDLQFNAANCAGCGQSCGGYGFAMPGCCWGGCVEFWNDPNNCGWCGAICVSGNCQNGVCQPVSTCPPDLTDCGGVCVDTGSDPANCGGCGIGCASQSGWGLCCWGGCVDPQTDPNNCGGCDTVCFTGNCENGACACPPSQTDCGGNCVDLGSDPFHCGVCFHDCTGVPPAHASSIGQCVEGVCHLVCDPGYINCPVDGSEACFDLSADPANCGTCGHVCAAGQACQDGVCVSDQPEPTATAEPTTTDRWALWRGKAKLRGAHILQRRVGPDDDPAAFGSGSVGPLYTQADFERLADLGANVVEIVHPVPAAERAPHGADAKARANLDRLIELAERAGLFAVIAFRTGPGRSEASLADGLLARAGACFAPPSDSAEATTAQFWSDEAALDAWAVAWAAAAERYRANPIVVGYDLLADPDPPTASVWARLANRLTSAVRDADPATPILVTIPGSPSEARAWKASDDDRTVYRHDLLLPERFIVQPGDEPAPLTYPGRFLTARDGDDGKFDRDWLKARVGAIGDLEARLDAPVAVRAFGVARWQPGAADFLEDELHLFDDEGLNCGLWLWHPATWPAVDDAFDLERGTAPDNHDPVDNELLDVVRSAWLRNRERPAPVSAVYSERFADAG